MKKLYVILLLLLIASTVTFAKKKQKAEPVVEQPAPRWMTDEGRLEIFPNKDYVSAFSYGDSEANCKSAAASDLSAYIKSNVESQKVARTKMTDANGAVATERALDITTKVTSDNDLYKVEYTTTYFDKTAVMYGVVAYIKRANAFNYVRPKLEKAANIFPAEYNKALSLNSDFEKVIAIKSAQKVLAAFYEVYDFARAISPNNTKQYESIDSLATKSFIQVSNLARGVHFSVSIINDSSDIIRGALEDAISKKGFTVVKSGESNHGAICTLTYEVKKAGEVFSSYPAVTIELKDSARVLYSFSKDLGKVAAFDSDTATRLIYTKVAKVIKEEFLKG